MTEEEYENYKEIKLYFNVVYKTTIHYSNKEYGITAACCLTDGDNYRVNFTPIMAVGLFEPEEVER